MGLGVFVMMPGATANVGQMSLLSPGGGGSASANASPSSAANKRSVATSSGNSTARQASSRAMTPLPPISPSASPAPSPDEQQEEAAGSAAPSATRADADVLPTAPADVVSLDLQAIADDTGEVTLQIHIAPVELSASPPPQDSGNAAQSAADQSSVIAVTVETPLETAGPRDSPTPLPATTAASSAITRASSDPLLTPAVAVTPASAASTNESLLLKQKSASSGGWGWARNLFHRGSTNTSSPSTPLAGSNGDNGALQSLPVVTVDLSRLLAAMQAVELPPALDEFCRQHYGSNSNVHANASH